MILNKAQTEHIANVLEDAGDLILKLDDQVKKQKALIDSQSGLIRTLKAQLLLKEFDLQCVKIIRAAATKEVAAPTTMTPAGN